MKTDRKLTAYHEAGHAIAAHRLDNRILIHSLSIRSEAGSLGQFRSEGLEARASDEQIQNEIIVLYAGEAAEAFAGVKAIRREEGLVYSDLIKARDLLDVLHKPEMKEQLRAKAEALVSGDENALHMIASELMEHGHLDGEEFAILMDISDGRAAANALEVYRQFRELAKNKTK